MDDVAPSGAPTRGIPTARNVDHVGITVPNLEQAVAFFVDVLGCDLLYRAGPWEDPDGEWFREHLDVHPRARLRLAMVRCGPVTNVELLEYRVPDPHGPVRNSDVGGAHLAFYVDEMEVAVAYLRRQPGVRILGEPVRIAEGPTTGLEYVYFLTPWGLPIDLARVPPGMPYERATAARAYGPAAAWDARQAG